MKSCVCAEVPSVQWHQYVSKRTRGCCDLKKSIKIVFFVLHADETSNFTLQ